MGLEGMGVGSLLKFIRWHCLQNGGGFITDGLEKGSACRAWKVSSAGMTRHTVAGATGCAQSYSIIEELIIFVQVLLIWRLQEDALNYEHQCSTP